jgi:hypothetical protein
MHVHIQISKYLANIGFHLPFSWKKHLMKLHSWWQYKEVDISLLDEEYGEYGYLHTRWKQNNLAPLHTKGIHELHNEWN